MALNAVNRFSVQQNGMTDNLVFGFQFIYFQFGIYRVLERSSSYEACDEQIVPSREDIEGGRGGCLNLSVPSPTLKLAKQIIK